MFFRFLFQKDVHMICESEWFSQSIHAHMHKQITTARVDVWMKIYRLNILEISIILFFGQQTEPPRLLSRSRNSRVNRRKINLKYPCA